MNETDATRKLATDVIMKILLLLASISLYALSLTAAAFPHCKGYEAVLLGALGMLTLNPGNLTWLANPLVILSWTFVFCSERTLAVVSAALAVAVAASLLICKGVILGEDGEIQQFKHYSVGYWLWLTSTLCAVASALSMKGKQADSATEAPL